MRHTYKITNRLLAFERPKLAFLCAPGMQNFIGDIVRHFEVDYQVRTCYDGSNKTLNEVIAWADIIWVEWANELAVAITHGLPLTVDKRVICRLHSYEAFAPFLQQIKWERVDDLIFVAPHIRDYTLQQVPGLDQKVKRIHVVPNGIDLQRFVPIERRPGKNLAFLGYINYKKGPMLLLHAFAELRRQYPTYRLFLGGAFQDDRYQLYFQQMTREMELGDGVVFDGWIEDVPAWLADKHYIVSTSVLEAHPVGIMEAMACGVKPIVHNFVGARNIFDSSHIWNSINDFVTMVRSRDYDSHAYRAFIENNYSLERQLSSLNELMTRVEVLA